MKKKNYEQFVLESLEFSNVTILLFILIGKKSTSGCQW